MQAAHQTSKCYWNGLSHADAKKYPTNGIHNWCEAGGIVGRGVLLDWLSWWEETNPGTEAPSPISYHAITVQELDAVAEKQQVNLQQADILIIRTGFVRWHK